MQKATPHPIRAAFIGADVHNGPAIEALFEAKNARILLLIYTPEVVIDAARTACVFDDGPVQKVRGTQIATFGVSRTQQVYRCVADKTAKMSRNKLLAVPRKVQNEL